ncbi:MAG TPA: hypothetical protein VK426_01505 [Methanobacterium sp.]|nr:hypothetical protein [Methanobacterium sp.]
MNFRPIISIIIGTIVALVLSFLIDVSLHSLPKIVLIITTLIGGFIATYFTKEKKIRYGIYVGISLTVISTLFLSLFLTNLIINDILPLYLYGAIVNSVLPASIGGFLGKMAYKESREDFKAKEWKNGITPPMAITIGFIFILSLLYWFSSFEGPIILIGFISFLIGGLTTTLIVKDNRIKYGLYAGLIALILSFTLGLYAGIITGRVISEEYYIKIIKIAAYIMAVIIGSYLGKIASKYLK